MEFEATPEVNTLVVSLACLLQFGTCVAEELPQRSLQHLAFREYEQGKITRSEAAARIASKYGVAEGVIVDLFTSISNSCSLDEQLLAALSATGKTLIGWIDIPSVEWNMLRSRFPSSLWQQFAYLVPSVPSVEECEFMVIVDRDVERVSLFNCQGRRAIPYTPVTRRDCGRFLKRLQVPRAIEMGRVALRRVIGGVASSFIKFETSGKQCYMVDYFVPALVATLTAYSGAVRREVSESNAMVGLLEEITSLVKQLKPFGFNGTNFEVLPPDVDTMSICTTSVLERGLVTKEEASSMLDIILSNVKDDMLLVYFDASRPRLDPVVLSNVLLLAYLLERESEPVIRHQEHLVQTFLLSGGYVWGTKYYPQPESFLFHYGRIVHRFSSRVPRYSQVLEAIKSALVNLVGTSSSAPLDIAKRLLLSSMFAIPNQVDLDLLLDAQNGDGAWTPTPIYVLPTTKGLMYNEPVDLCFILAALEQFV